MSLKSLEAEIILTKFANRKRIHKEKVVDIRRLYSVLISEGHKLSRLEFDNVFYSLEKLGYGTTQKSKTGTLEQFLPFRSIKQIGQELIKNIPFKIEIKDQVQSKGLVTVYFLLSGKTCKAVIPEDALDEFEKLVYH